MQMQYLVQRIPFFAGKKCYVKSNIYYSENYPACILVCVGAEVYKVRFPGILNEKSVQNESEALKFLSVHRVEGIPQVVASGSIDKTPYLIEYYIEGSSLDKIQHTFSLKEWEHIAKKIVAFLQSNISIQSTHSYMFKDPKKVYNCYGEIIKESILRHLNKHIISGLISFDTAQHIQNAINDIESSFHGKSSFLHFDIKPQNIIFNPKSGDVAFIDYEHARMGDYSHEVFRADMAVTRNPYFGECWQRAKETFLGDRSDTDTEENSRKLFYYKLLYNISEMTYSCLIGDKKQIATYQNVIEEIIRRY